MSKEDVLEVEGKVLEALPNAMFKVELRKWTQNFSSYFRKTKNALY